MPSLAQTLDLARALDVPLQRLLTGTDRPGSGPAGLATELRGLGASDLWVDGAIVPGAARRPEEVLALAVSGSAPDPRIVEALPALLAWNRPRPTLLRAFGATTGTTRRLAWLAEVALAIDRRWGFPGGCERSPLERFLERTGPPRSDGPADDLGQPGTAPRRSPIWKRWGIAYGGSLEDFRDRAEKLVRLRDPDAATGLADGR